MGFESRQAEHTHFEGFAAHEFQVDGATIFARVGGNPGGPALLLLHGFPETHATWQRVAQALGST